MNEFTVWKLEIISYGEILDELYFDTEELLRTHIRQIKNYDLNFEYDEVTVYTSA